MWEKKKGKSSYDSDKDWIKSVDHFRECGKYSEDPQDVHVLSSLTREYVAFTWQKGTVDIIKAMKVVLDYPGWPKVPCKREEGVQSQGKRCNERSAFWGDVAISQGLWAATEVRSWLKQKS